MNWLLLKNSLMVSGLTTLLAASFGCLAALWLAGLEQRWRHRMLAVAVMALALPPFLVTNCWLHFLGYAGVWRGWLPLNIVSLGGTVWILSLLTWPITMLMVLSAWQRLEPSQLECDVAVSGWWLIRGLLWPLGRTALAQAAVLTFVLAMNNFAVPAILQVKVFPAEMWVRFNTTFDTVGALQLSWPLVVAPLLLLLWFARREFPWPRTEGPVSARLFRQQLGHGWFWASGTCTLLLSLLAVGLPAFQLISVKRTWTELPGALAAGQGAVWSSFSLAAAAATMVMLLGLAAGTRRSSSTGVRPSAFGLPSGFGSRVSDLCRWLAWLPFLLPGVLLGIGLIFLFNRPWFALLYHGAAIVVLAFVIRYLALGWNAVAHAFQTVDRDLTEVAHLDGATRWQMLRHVQWPQIAPQAAAAWYIVYLLCLWDVESMILVVPPGGETLALRVFNLLHYGHNAQVNALCLTLLSLAVVPLVAWKAWDLVRGTMSGHRIDTTPLTPSLPGNHGNTQHPTSNIQHPAPSTSAAIRCWMLVVGCWMFSVRSGRLILLFAAAGIIMLTGCGPSMPPDQAPLQSQLFKRVQIIGSRGVGVGQLNKPRSVAVDGQDNLYVVDMTGRVQKFSSNGVFLLSWQLPQTELGKPKGMGRDRDGNIIVLEPHYQRVNVFSPEGKLLAQWGKRGTNAGELMMPRSVAVNSRRQVFLSEYGLVERVQEFTERGDKLLAVIGQPGNGPGDFSRPEGICVDAQDRLYVADSCNHRIEVFASDGKFLRAYGKAGKGKGELSYPYDICVDAAGRQYVCEFGNSRIQVFDANDRPFEIIGGPGWEPGQFSNPWGVALDSAGNLYVADSQNHRVQKLIPEMNFQFTHPYYLLLLAPALAWVIWFAWKSDVQVSPWRRWTALAIRIVVLLALVFALAGFQWLRPVEGMNVFFALDRSDSVPSTQQEAAREYVNSICKEKKRGDKAGIIVFGAEASIESSPNAAVDLTKIQAVVGTERTDMAAAIRLATAAFPETGQKRLVLMSDGNENIGDAMSAVVAAKPLGVTVDVVPMGVVRANDVCVQKLQVPPKLKEGQVFEVKIFVQADRATPATVRLFRDDQFLGEQRVELSAGKNLFTFPQTLSKPDFYKYDVQVDAPGDPIPQNNRATSFTSVRGEPRILVVSADPEQDKQLAAALKSPGVGVNLVGVNKFPGTLAEMQSYDAIFISNLAAGDLGLDRQRLLENAVRDFGVGLVCVGGDQTYAAGGYRGTPLEATLPVSMELDSKKVLPSGAVVLVMHGMEFANGDEVARMCAQGVLRALGPQDEMGVVLLDGTERWLFELQKVVDKKKLATAIAGMRQGDLGSFEGVLSRAHEALQKSASNLKHIIVFSDGDPNAPTAELMQAIVGDRITVSTVLISGHSPSDTMEWMAEQGKGRFYNVTSPDDLPQIFIKETAVILKSAIYEEPFQPQLRSASELVRGISATEYPKLLGYVATTPKPRAETPLWTDKGDPLLAHWQYGLGRAVAFTSDAKARWARIWLNWDKYRQFWSQIGQWSMQSLENADFTTEVVVDKGEGLINVEAIDEQGNFRNFLNLQAIVAGPKGERQTVRLEQTGPGHYEARFPTKEVGSYLLNLMDIKDGKVRGRQVIGTSINYSPEFNTAEPNLNLLRRITETGGGKILDPLLPAVNPFDHDRKKTFQPRDLWEALVKFAIILFLLDVGVRRIQIGRDEWQRGMRVLRSWLIFWRGAPRPPEAEESLAALLSRRQQVRSQQTGLATEPRPELFRPEQAPTQPLPGEEGVSTPLSQPPEAPAEPAKPPEEGAPSTTSRLLEAKRRAQKRK